jgi:putative ATPase
MATRSARPASSTGSSDDLFAAGLRERLERQAPLAARLRPTSLDDVVGQDHLLGRAKPLRRLIESDRLASIILWGPPGTGKTTLASLIATATSKRFIPMSAVTAGVKDVREAVESARNAMALHGQGTILFLDEIHRFNRAQQDALLPSVEDGTLVLVGATTENPMFAVNGPLLSRSTLFRLQPHSPESLRTLTVRALSVEDATADEDAIAHLIDRAEGDGRQLLTALEVAIALADDDARPSVDRKRVTLIDAEAAVDTRVLRYGPDEHYDVISAFIKSIRGSDPDAALHWLAKMLHSGEDPRFVARRLVIHATEDVGMADPMALVVADAAARAVEFIGMPEAQLTLAQATVHLACAPKSNRVALGIWGAMSDVSQRQTGPVPIHLRDAHYSGAERLGHGKGYRYPHQNPDGYVQQQYLPDDLVGTRYYNPSEHGHEARVAKRLAWLRGEQVDGATGENDGAAGENDGAARENHNAAGEQAERQAR